jgi:hypothetical protein
VLQLANDTRYVNFQSAATVPAAAVSIKQNQTVFIESSMVKVNQTAKQVLLQPIAAVVGQLQVCWRYAVETKQHQCHSHRPHINQ